MTTDAFGRSAAGSHMTDCRSVFVGTAGSRRSGRSASFLVASPSSRNAHPWSSSHASLCAFSARYSLQSLYASLPCFASNNVASLPGSASGLSLLLSTTIWYLLPNALPYVLPQIPEDSDVHKNNSLHIIVNQRSSNLRAPSSLKSYSDEKTKAYAEIGCLAIKGPNSK